MGIALNANMVSRCKLPQLSWRGRRVRDGARPEGRDLQMTEILSTVWRQQSNGRNRIRFVENLLGTGSYYFMHILGLPNYVHIFRLEPAIYRREVLGSKKSLGWERSFGGTQDD